MKKRQSEANEASTALATEKESLTHWIDELWSENQELNNQLIKLKLDSGREEALMKQEKEFQQKKIEDLMNQLNDSTKTWSEKLESQKSQMGTEGQEKLRKAEDECDWLQKKYNEKRQALRELERTSSSTIQENEWEIAVLKEKITSVEAKLKDIVDQKNDEIEKVKSKLVESKSKMSGDAQVL